MQYMKEDLFATGYKPRPKHNQLIHLSSGTCSLGMACSQADGTTEWEGERKKHEQFIKKSDTESEVSNHQGSVHVTLLKVNGTYVRLVKLKCRHYVQT